jgi:hypothetical protein
MTPKFLVVVNINKDGMGANYFFRLYIQLAPCMPDPNDAQLKQRATSESC